MVSSNPRSRRIPLWKLVGGAAVHFVVPAYAVALGVEGWHFAVHGGGDLAAWLAQVPGFSGWFLGLYAALGVGATGLAALVPASPPTQPVIDAAEHLRAALAQGRGAFGAEADEALNRIAALRPDVADVGTASMLRDLAAMVNAGRVALGGGDDARIRAMTAEAIGHIARELEERAGVEAQEARDRAQAMAGYVGQRYGQDEIQDILK